MAENDKARLAAVQAAPVWLDQAATAKKACTLIEEAADHCAQVIAFPETFIPCYPDWYHWFMPRSAQSLGFHKALFKNAVEVPGPTVDMIGAAARKTKTTVVVGVNEREPGTMGTLYNTLLFFGPDGALLGTHRKLMPTFTERLVHQPGDGSSVVTYSTPFGRIGGLVCGENGNGLARYALLAQQERIHVAAWPAFAAAERQIDGIHIRMRNMALEGQLFVISACGVLTETCLDAMGLSDDQRKAVPLRGGGSGILGPDGNYMAGPADATEQILYADADLDRIIDGKLNYDTVGHYNRFDVFTLTVRTAERCAMSRPQIEVRDCQLRKHSFS
jgi:aliphatic nitrilase